MASGTFRLIWILLGAILFLAGIASYRSAQSSIQTVRAFTVSRQNIHEGIVTNGKAEPVRFREVRAEAEGEIVDLLVRQGDSVRAGQKLMQISPRQSQAELELARAELAAAQEAIRLLRQGGTAIQIRELKAQLESARRERDQAARLAEQNARLVESGAVARVELEQSRARLAKAEADVALLESKLQQPYDAEEMKQAEARLEAAQASLNLAEFRSRSTSVTAPIQGVVYSLEVRSGDRAGPGMVLARIGELERIRVRVFVDEPDLGRVAAEQPVRITWDGRPGRQWQGQVDRLPSAVVELGSRTVGEVDCTVENPGLELLPNVNLNVEIITKQKSGVIVVPREAIVTEDSGRFVYLIRDNVLVRQAVQTGILNPASAEVLEGLQEGNVVALTGDGVLQAGRRVRVESQQ